MTIRKIFAAFLLFSIAIPAFAVTRQEMEKARAISAKIYLRWANNGSDYLDKLQPDNLAQLEGELKQREQDNLRAFKSIPVPGDFASWDKEKLVEYWSKTALDAKGLNADGVRQGARKQIRAKLGALTVTPPVVDKIQPPVEDGAKEAPSAQDSNAIPAAEAQAIAEAEVTAEAAVDSIDNAADSLAAPRKKHSSGNTWIYIVALALLVIAVIALVVYASKQMQGQNQAQDKDTDKKYAPVEDQPRRKAPAQPAADRPVSRASVAQPSAPAEPAATPAATSGDTMARMREKFAESLARKQEEIRILNRQISDLTEENKGLAAQNERMSLEAQDLRVKNDQLETRVAELSAAVASAESDAVKARAAEQQRPARPAAPAAPAAPAQPVARDIFLGRVNARGLFIRADKELNPGNSIYVLHTNDGFSGSFRVVTDPTSIDEALARPEEMLGGGCIAMDITHTAGATGIVTESSGTAIFEDNCWRVIRKARIRYV